LHFLLRRKRREEYRCIVEDKVEETKWKGLCVNDHWQQMKGIMLETAQDMCGRVHVGTRKHGGGMRTSQKQLGKRR